MALKIIQKSGATLSTYARRVSLFQTMLTPPSVQRASSGLAQGYLVDKVGRKAVLLDGKQ